ncbi:GtrA family protein [Actinomyces vulturis]|uniref:GtrA family protein n=1 Tax=Actinomyces vulturis TaxID=1857645 RepID=UPI0008357AC6|nr:GtrA family protein [Actinomyces vulturis]
MPDASSSSSPKTLRERIQAWVKEFVQFGLVGATAFVIDMGLFNLFQHGPLGFLSGHPNTANVCSATIATFYSWVANRLWTYRGRTQDNAAREAILFAFANIGGVGITQFCLLFTHHILHMHGPLADNVAAYVVGFGLGTAFRFIFYHYIVFTGHKQTPALEGAELASALGGPPEIEIDD